ncbi:MAG: response regulator [Candidatus Koribacter versatilis]|uniref:Response regulator n=1 Tax=Candidatus Korobacter versatilis TaxID=658062 RepID=A0A932EQL8_9BACT|nr:response regulator [Candidatus Koribacter versatilis]
MKTRVLFVDDEPGIRATLPAVLEMHDFEVTTASNVPAALELIHKEAFQVLLSDLNIGEPGDGFTVVSAMRRVQPDAVTIIITGFPAFETALEAIRSQVDDYIVKPTDAKHLVATIQNKLLSAGRPPRRSIATKRVREVIDDNRDLIVSEWLDTIERMPEIVAIPLSGKERTDHVPQVLDELVRVLRSPGPPEASRKALKAAAKHGTTRREQGYTIPMLLEEARILRCIITRIVQQNLLVVEISSLIGDLLQVEDSVCVQVNEAVRAFLGQEKKPRAA